MNCRKHIAGVEATLSLVGSIASMAYSLSGAGVKCEENAAANSLASTGLGFISGALFTYSMAAYIFITYSTPNLSLGS